MRTGLDTWKVESRDFPFSGTEGEKLQFLVNYAVLAPSKYNAQPWLFEICGDSLDLICDRSWAFSETDPQRRELILSCGAALLNLTIAARHFGYDTQVQPFPWPGDKYLLARVRLVPCVEDQRPAATRCDGSELGTQPARQRNQPRSTPEDEACFQALKRRCTARGAFQPRLPAKETLTACNQAVVAHGAWLHRVQDEPMRKAIAELVAQGDRQQMSNKMLRRELARWIHRPRGKSKDGFPVSRYGLHGPMGWLSPGVVLGLWAFNLGHLVAFHDRRLVENAPVLAVLGTEQDTPAAWLAAGQALERLWLRATAAGLSVSLFNQAIEVGNVRKELARLIGTTGFPQVLLRIGFGVAPSHTPRRPAKEVVI